MKTSMITVIGFAMAIAASPLSAPSFAHEHKGISHSQAKEVCTFGNAACCTTFKNEEEKSLLDLDILKEPLLKKLIGNEDSACMSFDLIGQLNILGFASNSHDEPYCKQTAACCSGNECHAIGGIDGK